MELKKISFKQVLTTEILVTLNACSTLHECFTSLIIGMLVFLPPGLKLSHKVLY